VPARVLSLHHSPSRHPPIRPLDNQAGWRGTVSPFLGVPRAGENTVSPHRQSCRAVVPLTGAPASTTCRLPKRKEISSSQPKNMPTPSLATQVACASRPSSSLHARRGACALPLSPTRVRARKNTPTRTHRTRSLALPLCLIPTCQSSPPKPKPHVPNPCCFKLPAHSDAHARRRGGQAVAHERGLLLEPRRCLHAHADVQRGAR